MYITAESAHKARELFGKFLLQTTSNGWGKDLRFIADVMYETANYFEKTRHPTIRADITLVEYGYQIDVTRDDEHTGTGSTCRDFGGAYEIDAMANYLNDRLFLLMRDFEKDFCAYQKAKARKPRRLPKSKKKVG